MVRYLTEAQKIEILIMRGCEDKQRTQQEVCDMFNLKYPNVDPITRSTVSKIASTFYNRGHVRSLPRNHQHVSEDTQLNILLETQENAHTTSRTIAANNEISQTSVLKYLKQYKWHPYKINLVQALNEDDPDRRIQFCEQMAEICYENPNFVSNIIFSDEATFYLNGTVNRQNCRYWAPRNPHWFIESHTQYPEKVNVWAAIVRDRILGPYFIEGTLTAEKYLNFLRDDLLPALATLYPNHNDPDIPDDTLWYQQDGAPPHYSIIVRNYLNNIFPNRWIGRRGQIEWPARSPDLTPLDFFLWGYLKSKVYFNRPNTIDELKDRIRVEMRAISIDVIRNVKNEFLHRLSYCQEVNGAQFEHLL